MAHEWIILGNEKPVANLGFSQLWYSGSTPSLFQIELVLNPYESRCLRDWLARRWQFKSLCFVSIVCNESMSLVLKRPFSASDSSSAIDFHECWLEGLVKEIEKARNARI